MKHILLALTLLLTAGPGHSVLHPVVVNPRILKCIDQEGFCTNEVFYGIDGLRMADVVPQTRPDPLLSTTLKMYGVHCDWGKNHNHPESYFSRCSIMTGGGGHAPGLWNCELRSTSSWELTADSTCYSSLTWGPHRGAGPGGECVFIAQAQPTPVQLMTTIFGIVDAETVANSGNRFCEKPLPPSVTCDVFLPATIDHGTVGPNSSSSVSIEGQLSCGANPVVSFLGGDRLALAPGVTTNLTARVVGAGRIQITSDLVSLGGETGYHSASTVIIVSPY